MIKSVKNRRKFQTNKNVYFAAHILVTGESSIMSILAYQALFPASLKRGLLAEAGISIYFILFMFFFLRRVECLIFFTGKIRKIFEHAREK